MKKALITGATGLVGSYLARYLLQKGYQVRCTKRAGSSLDLVQDIADKIEWVEADLLDYTAIEAALDGVNDVYHAAAMVSYAPGKRRVLLQVNAEGTANLVNACLEKPIRKLLHVSSVAAIGRTGKPGEIITEAGKWTTDANTSDYALSKHYAEREVWRGMAEGLQVVIVNPSVILGAGNWENGSSRLFHTIYKGFPFYTNGATGFVDVRDVARASVSLMESDIRDKRFLLNGANLPYKTIFDQMATALGVKGPTIRAGAFLSGLAWRAGVLQRWLTGTAPSVTKATARVAQQQYQFSSEKIQSALDYHFLPIATTIQDGAAAYLQYHQTGTTPALKLY
jgi:dihydroflavonol-4-reductase